ncbi:hypothetical protein B4088_0323 [Bacillus cereus]|uniref:Uncharacterized protein n=1 Tax=Bacillus cereus TaxID=1396 RepID=A0A164QLF1_BACCE|nr:hypothetical protein B4088_0323 [Bacillus cereus]
MLFLYGKIHFYKKHLTIQKYNVVNMNLVHYKKRDYGI